MIIYPEIPISQIAVYDHGNILAEVWQKCAKFLSRIIAIDSSERYRCEQLLKEVMENYDQMIAKICFTYSNSTDELNDLHQDALINIWQGLPYFKGESSLKTWVYRVTLNTCVSTLRQRKRRIRTTKLEEFYSIIDTDAHQRELITELHECISHLSPVDKAIVILWLDEFSYEEIADTVGLPRNTVASRLRRAKEKLKNI